MTDFHTDPEAAVADLIATLPDDFGKLTLANVKAICAAQKALVEIMEASADTEVDGLDRRYLSAERASDALNAWEERAGGARYGLDVEPREPAVMEAHEGVPEEWTERGRD